MRELNPDGGHSVATPGVNKIIEQFVNSKKSDNLSGEQSTKYRLLVMRAAYSSQDRRHYQNNEEPCEVDEGANRGCQVRLEKAGQAFTCKTNNCSRGSASKVS